MTEVWPCFDDDGSRLFFSLCFFVFNFEEKKRKNERARDCMGDDGDCLSSSVAVECKSCIDVFNNGVEGNGCVARRGDVVSSCKYHVDSPCRCSLNANMSLFLHASFFSFLFSTRREEKRKKFEGYWRS